MTKTFPEDHTIFFEGETGDKVYFLKQGQVKILKTSLEGKEQILEIINSGEVFGEVVLFGIDEYPATSVTKTEVTLNVLKRERFKNYYYKNPHIGWGMLKVMARKLYRSQHRIKSLGLRNTKGRVASLIIDMYNKSRNEENFTGENSENDLILNINQQEMADFIGTSRETVSRTLSLFRRENLIQLEGSKLTILDFAGLKEYL
ncbi:MAG: Crp/Fnr family transcriptional regulator [Halanaerobiales bacterium]